MVRLRALTRFLRDKQVPAWKRWLLFGGLLYALVPFDVIPDVVPVVGWLDDVGVLSAIAVFLSREVARHELTATTPDRPAQ